MKTTLRFTILILFIIMGISVIPVSAQPNGKPLMIGIKTGYSMPADGDIDAIRLTGVEAQFAITDKQVFMIEFDSGAQTNISGSYSGNISQAGNVITEYSIVSLMHFSNGLGKPGIYYGGGVAFTTFRFNSIFTLPNGSMFLVSSRPSRFGALLTLGFGGRKKFFVEARYLFTGKKAWNPFNNQKTDLGGFSLNAGYRLAR